MIIRHSRTRTVLAAIAVVLPGSLRRFVHRRLLGYDIDPEARVGHAFIDVDRLRVEAGASIGSLTAIRGCEDVELGPEATIGPLVWVNAVRRSGRYSWGRNATPR